MNYSDIDRIKLLISYNSKKTYTENLTEQSELAMDRRLGIEKRNMEALGLNPSSREDIKKYQSSITNVSGKSISEALLNAREFLFSTEGMVTQIVISILGAEIGAPILIATLDSAILVNDLQIMLQNWEEKPFDSEENWFIHHFTNNVGFKNSVEDIAFMTTGGVLRLIGKTAKSAWNLLKSVFGPKGSFRTWFKGAMETVKEIFGKISKIPSNPIKKWAEKQKKSAEDAVSLLSKGPSNVGKYVLKQVPKSIAGGFLVYGAIECVFKKIFERDSNESVDMWISAIRDANPDLKLTGKEKFEFPEENCYTKSSPYIYINGVKYGFANVKIDKDGNTMVVDTKLKKM